MALPMVTLGDPAPSEDNLELAAHVAAVQEAEAELVKLNSRIDLAKLLIEQRRQRREQRADKRLDLEVHAQELQAAVGLLGIVWTTCTKVLLPSRCSSPSHVGFSRRVPQS